MTDTEPGKVARLVEARGDTDNALAMSFAESHKDDLRHVAVWNKWVRWTGSYWAVDKTRFAFDLVRRHCVETKGGQRAARESAKKINAVHTLAMGDRRLAGEADAWDRDPDAFNQRGRGKHDD